MPNRSARKPRYATLWIAAYRSRLSGPLLDRIDLHVDVPALDHESLASAAAFLSARAHHRVLRVARSIADLAFEDDVAEHHVAEALHYRGEGRVTG